MSVARRTVSETEWRAAIATLAEGKRTLSALWAEADTVHMALLDESCGSLGVVSLPAAGGRYPSVGALHPPAIRPERALRDLTGLTPVGLPDERRWLNHGRWRDGDATSYEFLPAEGESLHQIAVGPVHAGIIEPGHFRFTANGETIVRLEARLGYVHKGIAALMTGADLPRAMQLAARASGDSTVAYQIAFARAVEDATDTAVPARAAWLRALMGELERIANHLGDIGAICNDAAFPLLHAHTGVLRERVLRYSAGAFGHRLMMDTIVPSGVRRDLDREHLADLDRLIAEIRAAFPRIVEVYDNTASLQDRTVGTGTLKAELARQFGAGGYVGRASGRSFDARKALPYPPYDVLPVDVPVVDEGDVNARVWVRIREVEQSLTLLVAMRHQLPSGPLQSAIGPAAREGVALIEGFRGDVFAFVRMNADGTVAHCHLRDPSQFQWPLLEAAIEGNIVADFPLCNKSFNCSYAGHDM